MDIVGPFDPSTGTVGGYGNAELAKWLNADPSSGQTGAYPPAEAFTHPMREIVAAITAAGLTPDHTDLTQLATARRMLRLRETLVEVGAGGVTITSADESKTYVLDLSTRETITLPNPDDVPAGFSVVVATTGDPSGFQTAYVDVDSGSGSTDIVYRGYDHDPFYLIGRGESFQFVAHPNGYVAYLIAQPKPTIIYRTASGLTSPATVAATWNSMTLTAVSGDSSLFSLTSVRTSVPVTGQYFFRGIMDTYGTTGTLKPVEIGLLLDTTFVEQISTPNNVDDTFARILQLSLTYPYEQGTDFLLAARATGGDVEYAPNSTTWTVALVGR